MRCLRRKAARGRPGFTLIEMMIVIGIIAILASIAMPKYQDLFMKSKEGGTKGNLASMRSALNIYYADNAGNSPACQNSGADAYGPNSSVLSDALIPKDIADIPYVDNGLHPATNAVFCDFQMDPALGVHDGQGWYYDGEQPSDPQEGGIWVACAHDDTSGIAWTSY